MPEALKFAPILDHPSLVSPTVFACVQNWQGQVSANEFLTAEIDPDCAGGKDFCALYGLEPDASVNCLIVSSKRDGAIFFAACLTAVGQRTDLNGVVKRHLGVRVSLAPKDEVLAATQMEYGSITPFGLPPEWPVLVDSKLVSKPRITVGGGLRKSKLSVPGMALRELKSAVIIDGLGLSESASV